MHDRGEYDGQLWISMDFVDGLDAAQLLTKRYPAGMPATDVAPIVTAVASALDAAHRQSLLHRDVKPANIMLTHVDDDTEQRILLTDFGIARSVDDISGLTATNMTVGTVAYCAPEQLLGEDLDGRADQYALAATAYHLLTGKPLFANSNPAVVISRHLNTAPPHLGDTRAELAALDPVIAAGLAKRPEDRFARCSDFARALAEAIGSADSPSAAPTTPARIPRLNTNPPPKAPPVSNTTTAQRKITTRTVAAVAAGVLAVIIVGGILLLRPWQHQSLPNPAARPPTPSLIPASPPPQLPIAVTTTPPPPTFSARAIDQVLLTANQLTRILGIAVTEDPAGDGAGGLAIDSSAYGTGDHATQVTPQSCVGVVYTGEHGVYATSGAPNIKTQTFGHTYGGADGPHLVQQTAAVFATAEAAGAFLDASQTQWKSCARGEVQAILGYENAADYTLGAVQRQGNVITVSMATNGGENGPDACQQSLGVRNNVVVEARTCQIPDTTTTFDPTARWPKDPDWAVPDAERIATTMFDNVQP